MSWRHLCFPVLLAACWSCSVRTEAPLPKARRDKIVALANSLVGLPYHFGGTDIDGFDCSGLVYYVYHCFGLEIPRSAREQANMSSAVPWKSARPADILVFRFAKRWHAGIYVGDNNFIHAPNDGEIIRTEPLNSFWLEHLRAVIDAIDKAGGK
jgi:cell wall-associated NlpC family hydrolase